MDDKEYDVIFKTMGILNKAFNQSVANNLSQNKVTNYYNKIGIIIRTYNK